MEAKTGVFGRLQGKRIGKVGRGDASGVDKDHTRSTWCWSSRIPPLEWCSRWSRSSLFSFLSARPKAACRFRMSMWSIFRSPKTSSISSSVCKSEGGRDGCQSRRRKSQREQGKGRRSHLSRCLWEEEINEDGIDDPKTWKGGGVSRRVGSKKRDERLTDEDEVVSVRARAR